VILGILTQFSSEKSIISYRLSQRNIPEDLNPHNLKSQIAEIKLLHTDYTDIETISCGIGSLKLKYLIS
jgi:hypothetical protein